MTPIGRLAKGLRRHSTPIVAIVLVVGLYVLSRPPVLASDERVALASRFHFTKLPLPELPGHPQKFVRAVHPSLARISAWISSVGAAVALADLDGRGLPNDVCYVDPRTDLVIVAPVPGTPPRFAPFALDPAPLPYDPSTMAPMGCLAGHLKEDGLIDLLVYYWGRTPIAFLRKAPSAAGGRVGLKATDFVPYEVVPGGERWYTNAAVLADLDGDGHLDLVVANYFPDGARILDTKATDVATMHNTFSKASNGGQLHLLRWVGATSGANPTVRFEEAKEALPEEAARGWTLAVGAADLDGDLLPELYIANDFGPDRLLHNRSTPGHVRFAVLEGERGFRTPASFVLGRDSFKGMGVDFGDLNGSGLLDIVVSNIATQWGLQESHFVWLNTGKLARMRDGVAPYVQASERLGLSRSGWGWDVKLADFDNSGELQVIQAMGFIKGQVNRWPELQELGTGSDQIVQNPRVWPTLQPGADISGGDRNAFFVRAKDGRYYDIAHEVGLDESMVSRGIAIADVDGTGRLSFAVANQWGPSYFYRNDSPHPGAFLGLHLLLPLQPGTRAVAIRPGHPGSDTLDRPAIGAAATVHLPNGRRRVAQVDGGNGHSGKRSPDLHFGLGHLPSTTRLRVDLQWRDGSGTVHHETVQLSPGWHTVRLSWPAARR